jgi:hypothetical protein
MNMKRLNSTRVWIAGAVLATTATLPFRVFAGPGHDHGEEKAPSNTAVAPRFSSGSAQFEAVGIVQAHQLHLYIDNAKTNEPLETTAVELNINNTPLTLTKKGTGHFESEMPDTLEEGHLAVNITIEANGYTEVLDSELELEHDHAEERKQHASPDYTRWGLYGLMGLALIGGLSLAFKTIQRIRRTSR